MQKTERDLLIQLDTKVEQLIKTVDSVLTKMDLRDEVMDRMAVRVATVEEKVQENTKFRAWVYTSLVGSLLSIVSALLSKLGVI